MDMQAMAAHSAKAAQLMKMLSNHSRLMLLCTLVDGERSVGELNALLPLSQSALSQHLASLREAELVETRRDGQSIFYRLKDPEENPAVAIINTLHSLYCPENS